MDHLHFQKYLILYEFVPKIYSSAIFERVDQPLPNDLYKTETIVCTWNASSKNVRREMFTCGWFDYNPSL